MPRRKKLSLVDGDLFLLPVSNGRALVGQVIFTAKGSNYIVVFDQLEPFANAGEIKYVLGDSSPIFWGNALSTALEDGAWPIFGNEDPDKRKFLPAVIERVRGTCFTESFSGELSRPATNEEQAILLNRKYTSSKAFEAAGEFYLGLRDKKELEENKNLNEIISGLFVRPRYTTYELFGVDQ